MGLATDSFISQSNLAVCTREVRVGQEALGIKQTGYTGHSVCMCLYPPPFLAKKDVCMTRAHVKGYYKEQG